MPRSLQVRPPLCQRPGPQWAVRSRQHRQPGWHQPGRQTSAAGPGGRCAPGSTERRRPRRWRHQGSGWRCPAGEGLWGGDGKIKGGEGARAGCEMWWQQVAVERAAACAGKQAMPGISQAPAHQAAAAQELVASTCSEANPTGCTALQSKAALNTKPTWQPPYRNCSHAPVAAL